MSSSKQVLKHDRRAPSFKKRKNSRVHPHLPAVVPQSGTKEGLIAVKINQLRDELVELAFTLDGRGRYDAADVAMNASARLAELLDGKD